MSAREIITLQLGNYTNYVGTHWWNIQESGFSYDPNATPGDIDHDTLFREGVNQRGDVTYTPRLLLVDLKGSLKHLPRSGGALYGTTGDETAVDGVCWDDDGQLDVQRADPAAKSLYQQQLDGTAPAVVDSPQNEDDADAQGETAGPSSATTATATASPPVYDFSKTVETWTDFMYARYHPRSINIIESLDHSPVEASLDTFAAGAALWRGAQFEDGDYADRIRQYIEECNSCQGFQLLWDAGDGFSGLAAGCLEHVADEYGKTMLAVPLFEGCARDFKDTDAAMSDSIRVVNIAMGYASALAEGRGASLMVPLSTARQAWRARSGRRDLSLFGYDERNGYESSAVLATYLDTITLEYRRKAAVNNLASFCSSLNNYGRRLAGAGLAMPFRFGADEQLIMNLDQLQLDTLFTQLSPNTRIGSDRIVQHVSVRGVPATRLKNPLQKAGEQIRMAAYGCSTAAEMLQLYFQCSMYASLTHVASSEAGMPVRTPFPVELFDERVRTPHGWWQEWAGGELPADVPVMACVQTGTDLAQTVESLHREAKRVKLAKIPRFAAAGMEPDELSEALERLLEFQDNYDDAFEL